MKNFSFLKSSIFLFLALNLLAETRIQSEDFNSSQKAGTVFNIQPLVELFYPQPEPYTPETEELTSLPVKPAPEELEILKKSYPDIQFSTRYDVKLDDTRIELKQKNSQKETVLYWCQGKMLPENEIKNQENYWPLLNSYPKELKDPATFTETEKKQLKEYGTRESRRNGKGTPMFFYDFVYNAQSQRIIENSIKQTTFLGHRTRIHKKIEQPLKQVETQIQELAKTDKEVKDFVSKIKTTDAYYWRLIDGTNRKSFHSLGIAMDIVPKRITGEIFWSWARDKNPSGWMLTPLSRRWLPPQKVIEIFEANGFIWGGKWMIWDNMHFEYHPETLLYNK